MSTQRIALFGSPGEATQRILTQALRRGHLVTAIVPDEREFFMKHPNLKVVEGNVRRKEDVKRYATEHDVVISTHEPTETNLLEHVAITRSLVEGVRGTGIRSLLSAAHPLMQPMERTKQEYEHFKRVLKAQQEALKLFQNEREVQWGYLHSIEPWEEKPGTFKTNAEALLTNPEGESRIPVKEYASAIINEAEKSEMEFHLGEEEKRGY